MQDLKAIRFFYDDSGAKVSHDYKDKDINMFSYRELFEIKSPFVGLPCKQNGLLIVDVDVPGVQHKHDGRPAWQKLVEELGIPDTYTVETPTGGIHYYFRLPLSVNPDLFRCPAHLAQGIDLKWNGWVGAPPTAGYKILKGNLQMIQDVPPSLMAHIHNILNAATPDTYVAGAEVPSLNLHKPFTAEQLNILSNQLHWMQQHAKLTRAEWRDGIFALKAGIEDEGLLHEYVNRWTMNKSYVQGDENEAWSIAQRADRHGPIGPGSIFAIIKNVMLRENVPLAESPLTVEEIFRQSGLFVSITKDGSPSIIPSETNIATLIGTVFKKEELYHDVRQDLYMFKGRPCSDQDIVNAITPVIQSADKGLKLEKIKKTSISSALDVLMSQRRVDPHYDYLKNLVWDGVPRIAKFFIDYCGVEDNEYHRLVGKNFWVSLAARGLNPGAKMDTMVVIEGHQGLMKSTLVEVIGGDFTVATSNRRAMIDLEELRKMHQGVIVELPELVGLIGESDENVKNFLAKRYDHIRALFAKKAVRSPRGFVLVGTTNSSRYLSSGLGARRFWPVRIPDSVDKIKISEIKSVRDQLFAEAIAEYKNGYSYWHMPISLLNPIIATRLRSDPIASYILENMNFVATTTLTDLYRRLESGGIVTKGLTPEAVTRIENSLERIGATIVHDKNLSYWKFPWATNQTLDNLI